MVGVAFGLERIRSYSKARGVTCGVLCCHDGINEDKFFSKELAIEFRTCGTSDSSIIMKSNISPNESQCHASAHREPDQGTAHAG